MNLATTFDATLHGGVHPDEISRPTIRTRLGRPAALAVREERFLPHCLLVVTASAAVELPFGAGLPDGLIVVVHDAQSWGGFARSMTRSVSHASRS